MVLALQREHGVLRGALLQQRQTEWIPKSTALERAGLPFSLRSRGPRPDTPANCISRSGLAAQTGAGVSSRRPASFGRSDGGGLISQGAPAVAQVAAQHPQYAVREEARGAVLEPDDPDHRGGQRLVADRRGVQSWQIGVDQAYLGRPRAGDLGEGQVASFAATVMPWP